MPRLLVPWKAVSSVRARRTRHLLKAVGVLVVIGGASAALAVLAINPAPPPEQQEAQAAPVVWTEQALRHPDAGEPSGNPYGGLRDILQPGWMGALPMDGGSEQPPEPSELAGAPLLPSEPPAPLDLAQAPIPAPRPADLAESVVVAPLPPRRPRDLPAVVAALTPPAAAPVEPPQAVAAYAPSTAALTREEPPPLTPMPDAPGEFQKGNAAFVRIFKKEATLELWLRRGGRFALYRSFPICAFSGKLGPKVRQGDQQAPEGFYNVSARQLNPKSAYHLAFNVGFPNAYDRQNKRSGSALMVHGDCKSVGCYAMTNKGIEEIYSFVEAALRNGQREVPVHIFPFRMTQSNIDGETKAGLFSNGEYGQWADFWQNLKEGHDLFERTREPPSAYACGGRYAFNGAGRACSRIAGW